MNSIYLDHNATTPLDPLVRAEMEKAWDAFGNPSSLHAQGQAARALIDRARSRVAKLIGAQPDEILLTGGGTEADNLAIQGVASLGANGSRQQVLASAIEHQAVLNPCRHLQAQGKPVFFIPVDDNGLVRLNALSQALQEKSALVSVMLANNDTGVIEPVAEIVSLAKVAGSLVHTDAVQAVGKIPVDVKALGVDFLSFSSHKLNGPMGVGALYIRRGVKIAAILFGGHQEKSLRPGTENVPGISGFGKACELASQRLQDNPASVTDLRVYFENEILKRIPGTSINSVNVPRLPNTANIAFEGLNGEALAINLDLLQVAVSTGAACATMDQEPSHVLTAMGQSREKASSAIRFSLSHTNSPAEIEEALVRITQAVASIRESHA
jgi:cysteine desulfurase